MLYISPADLAASFIALYEVSILIGQQVLNNRPLAAERAAGLYAKCLFKPMVSIVTDARDSSGRSLRCERHCRS